MNPDNFESSSRPAWAASRDTALLTRDRGAPHGGFSGQLGGKAQAERLSPQKKWQKVSNSVE